MQQTPLKRTLGLVAGYMLCFWAVRLIFVTVVAYAFVRAQESSPHALQRIGDVVRANQVLTYGFAALAYVLILHAMHPLTHTKLREVFNLAELKRCAASGSLNGLILTAVLLLGTALGGHLSYLGFYMRFDEVVVSMLSAGAFAAAFIALVLVEEFILRAALETKIAELAGPAAAMVVSSVVLLLFRYSQFDLTWLAALNLILLNLALSSIARFEGGHHSSAIFLATFYILNHVLFGLPFMSEDMPGILLLRSTSDDGIGSLLSGGTAGPEAGFVLTILLIIYLYLPQIRSKKIEV